jgi:CarD family transcriptional regulator
VAFEIGDKVIYPNHGLGVIERVEEKTIMGTTCGFYQLRMASETLVFVPVDNVDGVGLRRAVGADEIEKLFGHLSDGKIESHQNWKGRFKDNSDRMRTGSIYDVIEVLKSLTHLSKGKSLSFREKRMLDRARFLVVSEIAEVVSEESETVDKKVDEALEACFVLKIKREARAKAASASRAKALKAKAAKARAAKAKAKAKTKPKAKAKAAGGSTRRAVRA